MTEPKKRPFSVDVGKALDALGLAWSDEYDEITEDEGKWTAHHQDAPEGDVITAGTPDELNRLIRADWQSRQDDLTQRGPSGMPPS